VLEVRNVVGNEIGRLGAPVMVLGAVVVVEVAVDVVDDDPDVVDGGMGVPGFSIGMIPGGGGGGGGGGVGGGELEVEMVSDVEVADDTSLGDVSGASGTGSPVGRIASTGPGLSPGGSGSLVGLPGGTFGASGLSSTSDSLPLSTPLSSSRASSASASSL